MTPKSVAAQGTKLIRSKASKLPTRVFIFFFHINFLWPSQILLWFLVTNVLPLSLLMIQFHFLILLVSLDLLHKNNFDICIINELLSSYNKEKTLLANVVCYNIDTILSELKFNLSI